MFFNYKPFLSSHVIDLLKGKVKSLYLSNGYDLTGENKKACRRMNIIIDSLDEKNTRQVIQLLINDIQSNEK